MSGRKTVGGKFCLSLLHVEEAGALSGSMSRER